MIIKSLVSVCLSTYNGEKYLKEQLDSILSQTYKNLELIITDDCSNDSTVSIINEFQKKYPYVKLYLNEKNLGFVKNFEKAISLSTGEYIALADQDDVWQEDKIEILVKELENTKDCLMVYSNAQLVDNNLNSKNTTLLGKIKPMFGNNNLYFIYNNSISGNTLMFKKELKEKILPIPNNINFHDIWISFVASSISNIKYLNNALVLYRQHESNVTDIYKVKKKKSIKEKILNKEKSFFVLLNKLESFYFFLEKNNLDSNKKLIFKLLTEYKKFDNYLLNFNLFKLLYQNKEVLFHEKKKITTLKLLKMSFGLKLFKYFPFV